MEFITELQKMGLPTIIALLIGLFGLIKGIESAYKWISEKFMYLYNKKNKSEKLVNDVNTHNSQIQSIHEKLDLFIDSVNRQQEMNDKYDRDVARIMLLDIYEKAKHQGYITMIQLETFDSLYESYTAKNGNGLIHNSVFPAIHAMELKQD